nr:unnamed protein product [Callosobruchus chinensis]
MADEAPPSVSAESIPEVSLETPLVVRQPTPEPEPERPDIPHQMGESSQPGPSSMEMSMTGTPMEIPGAPLEITGAEREMTDAPLDITASAPLDMPGVPMAVPAEMSTENAEMSQTKMDMEEAKEEDPPKKITICIKTPSEKESFDVNENVNVKVLKEQIASKFSAEPDQLCLIFAGKIMDDIDNIQDHHIKDGMTVHLMIRAAPRTPEAGPQRPPADVSASPFHLGALGGISGLQQLGMGTANFMEIQNQMQNELLTNPNMLRNLLENPLVMQLMNNPDVMRNLVTRNPQMQELLQRYPEIGDVLNNPELLKNTSELAKNPSMLQELMRSHERLLGIDPSSPTPVTNPIPNLFQNIQEPGLTSLRAQFQASATTMPGTGVMYPPPLASLLQQMSENTTLVQSMLQAPYTQSVMEAMAADPNVAHALLAQNPLITNNPVLQNQIRAMVPQMLQQMQNPEIQNLMTNSQALDAIMQIQQGMESLRQAAPSLVHTMAPPPPIPPNDLSKEGESAAAGLPKDAFSEFMARMVASMAAKNDSTMPPEQRYQPQLEYLFTMGFKDKEANLKALVSTFGDVNTAADMLLRKGLLTPLTPSASVAGSNVGSRTGSATASAQLSPAGSSQMSPVANEPVSRVEEGQQEII